MGSLSIVLGECNLKLIVPARRSWLNVGGNSAVTTGGIADKDVPGGAIIPATSNSGAYDDLDGARATRMLNCQGDKCTF